MSKPIFNSIGLTDRLISTLQAIADHMAGNKGVPPTLSELGDLINPPVTKGAVWQQLKKLEQLGYITRDPSLNRSISLTEKALEILKGE